MRKRVRNKKIVCIACGETFISHLDHYVCCKECARKVIDKEVRIYTATEIYRRLQLPVITSLDLKPSRDNKFDVCVMWRRGRNSRNMPAMRIRSSKILVYRWIYEVYYGKNVDNLAVRHICANWSCINPNHLYTREITWQPKKPISADTIREAKVIFSRMRNGKRILY